MAKLILIAEDDDDEAFAIGRTLTTSGIKNSFKRARDGAEVIAYLKTDGPFADRKRFPLPDVLLLDLKMPGIGGLAVLEWLNGQKQFRRYPLVVVLSGYYNKENLQRACSLGARSFLIKPCTVVDVVNLIRAYPSYWHRGAPQQFPANLNKASGTGGSNARAFV